MSSNFKSNSTLTQHPLHSVLHQLAVEFTTCSRNRCRPTAVYDMKGITPTLVTGSDRVRVRASVGLEIIQCRPTMFSNTW